MTLGCVLRDGGGQMSTTLRSAALCVSRTSGNIGGIARDGESAMMAEIQESYDILVGRMQSLLRKGFNVVGVMRRQHEVPGEQEGLESALHGYLLVRLENACREVVVLQLDWNEHGWYAEEVESANARLKEEATWQADAEELLCCVAQKSAGVDPWFVRVKEIDGSSLKHLIDTLEKLRDSHPSYDEVSWNGNHAANALFLELTPFTPFEPTMDVQRSRSRSAMHLDI
eukprot:TRINITY_DN23843_c0_g1_i3.p1 TRINITY_DN23843_c0_g1~~TRINITY_DN23843_c0_g1_i3.p1  ORF type:complete len:228 (-),score=68.18 TRINITY_DN23843_c0_g1_i3:181-864(-)